MSKKAEDVNPGARSLKQPVPRPLPAPLSDVATDVGRIEEVAHKAQMTEVLYRLRRAKLAWMRGAGSTKTTQSSKVEFL